jgi:hypothetical protein
MTTPASIIPVAGFQDVRTLTMTYDAWLAQVRSIRPGYFVPDWIWIARVTQAMRRYRRDHFGIYLDQTHFLSFSIFQLRNFSRPFF